MKIKKAIFPVGGLGTRFLPATKALPKEMLPIVDKPLIQYAVEEAVEAGCEELIFVTGRGKTAIEDHFDHSFELESALALHSRERALEAVRAMLRPPAPWRTCASSPPRGSGTRCGARATWWATSPWRCCWPTTSSAARRAASGRWWTATRAGTWWR